jgi:hypothetical protein
MMLKSELNRLSGLSRRQLIARAAKTALGVTILPAGIGAAHAQSASSAGRAKHVIYLYMQGGMSHIDTFDPKTGDTKGFADPISTKGDFQLGGYLTESAKVADKFTIIRSMTSKSGVHEQGTYLMHTGYEKRSTIVHPSMGAWASSFLGKATPSLPDSVSINASNQHPGAGFFPPSLSPVPITDPEVGLQNIKHTAGTEGLFSKRIGLMNEFDAGFRKKYQSNEIKAYNDFYDETLKLMKSEDLKAFDISQEPEAIRTKYGKNSLGQGCLLARRLIQHGVRFIEVEDGGWDMHNYVDEGMKNRGQALDQAFATLLTDLESQGLLSSTLVVIGSEFGRTPEINENSGRDHYPKVYSTVFAGAGVKGGTTYGASDARGAEVADKGVTIQDFVSTIGYAMGLPVDEVVMSPSNRPFTVGDKGKPVTEIFS